MDIELFDIKYLNDQATRKLATFPNDLGKAVNIREKLDERYIYVHESVYDRLTEEQTRALKEYRNSMLLQKYGLSEHTTGVGSLCVDLNNSAVFIAKTLGLRNQYDDTELSAQLYSEIFNKDFQELTLTPLELSKLFGIKLNPTQELDVYMEQLQESYDLLRVQLNKVKAYLIYAIMKILPAEGVCCDLVYYDTTRFIIDVNKSVNNIEFCIKYRGNELVVPSEYTPFGGKESEILLRV